MGGWLACMRSAGIAAAARAPIMQGKILRGCASLAKHALLLLLRAAWLTSHGVPRILCTASCTASCTLQGGELVVRAPGGEEEVFDLAAANKRATCWVAWYAGGPQLV